MNLTLFINELNESETITVTRSIINALVNTTTSTQEPIFAQDIDLAVQTISTLNKYEDI